MNTKEYIRQCYTDGVPVKKIAEKLGISRKAVKSRAARDPQCPAHAGGFSSRGKIDSDAHRKEINVAQNPTKAELFAFEQHCKANNLPFANWRGFWHKTQEYSAFFVNKDAAQEDEQRFQQMIADVKKHAPKYKKRKVEPTGEHILVLPQADIHVGKWASAEETGADFNSALAVKRAQEGTDVLVGKAAAFGVKRFVVCIGNDILHTDNGKTSTSGTPQDTDGSWFFNFRLARDLYVGMIEQLALHGDVYLIYVPSNHDWRSGYSLAETVAGYLHNHPHVNLMVTERHRKYLVYGNNLLMFSHGDGAKQKDLHWLMATESKDAWAKTSHRYIYLGHLHHTIKRVQGHQNAQTHKDHIGFTEIDASVIAEADKDVNIMTVPSSSGTDGWHDRNGYTARPGMMAFLHHYQDGRVCDFTHWF